MAAIRVRLIMLISRRRLYGTMRRGVAQADAWFEAARSPRGNRWWRQQHGVIRSVTVVKGPLL
jgi:hypothetical protein